MCLFEFTVKGVQLLLPVAGLLIREQLLMQRGPLCTRRRKIRTGGYIFWRGLLAALQIFIQRSQFSFSGV